MRVAVIVAATIITLAIHYGWPIEALFGHVHWLHAVHGRFCYIPIVIAAAWFGLRGGVIAAAVISVSVLPIVLASQQTPQNFAGEVAEVVFYFAIAVLIGVLIDRERSAQSMREDAQRQAEHAQKLSLVGQIASGVAHEVKNPLASIKGAADILTADNTSPEERAEFKEILHNEVRRIDTTVGEFLEFARPKEARRDPLDLSEALRPALKQMQALAAQQGIVLEHTLQENVLVYGDAQKLHQLTVNLLLNAIQASKEGGRIRADLASANGRATLSLTDHGAGIDQADIDRILEPFFTTRASGTGLGLAVAKAIVEAHEGTLAVDSEKGRGTTVVVSLPLRRGGNADPARG